MKLDHGGITQSFNSDTLAEIHPTGGFVEVFCYLSDEVHVHVGYGIDHPRPSDLAPLGIPRVALTRAVRRGQLERVGRGLYDEAAFLDYTAWVHEQFAGRGTPLLATFWCPHHPEAGSGEYRVECECRKPRPGMLLAAIERFGIDPARSLLIGDTPSDVEAAHAAGVAGRLLAEGDWGPGMAGLLGVEA